MRLCRLDFPSEGTAAEADSSRVGRVEGEQERSGAFHYFDLGHYITCTVMLAEFKRSRNGTGPMQRLQQTGGPGIQQR